MTTTFDIRPITANAEATLVAQKIVQRLRGGEDPEIVWTSLLDIVDAHGLHSVPAAAFIREIGKRVR